MGSDNETWSAWAPYWEHLEDRHFGRRALDRVLPRMSSPVLVIGAGIGLLVERLQQAGHTAFGVDRNRAMVSAAKRRRGLGLAAADAERLPFRDESFRTVILSSGVADYAEDAEAGRYLRESLRVLAPGGQLVAGFHRFEPPLERAYLRLGVIRNDRYHPRRIFELEDAFREELLRPIILAMGWTGRGFAASFAAWLRLGLFRPRALEADRRRSDAAFAQAAKDGLKRGTLIEAFPESVPYRDGNAVRSLVTTHGCPDPEIVATPDCLLACHRKASERVRGEPGGDWILRLENVTHRYPGASRDAVHALDLTIPRGTVFGILGPNGAGKTTTMSLLAGLLVPDRGTIRFAVDAPLAALGVPSPPFGRGSDADVCHPATRRTQTVRNPERSDGTEPRAQRRASAAAARAMRVVLGPVPQNLALYPKLTARENLRFFGGLYGLSGAGLERRIDDLLGIAGLSEYAQCRVETYSTGMMRRLNLMAGLVHDPGILLLDEPTVGIDPQSRNRIFELVLDLRRRGRTVLLTTQYLEEASRLCDRLVIMDHGTVLVEGAPAEIVARSGSYRVEFDIEEASSGFLDAVRAMTPAGMTLAGGILCLSARDGAGAMALLEKVPPVAREHRTRVLLRRVTEPTLENVFLDLTGRSMRDAEAA